MTTKKGNFESLFEAKIPADKIEKKNGFDYLKWSYAWSQIKKRHPDASFEKHWFTVGEPSYSIPYAMDKKGFAYVKVTVTIDGDSITETFPVLDYRNKAVQTPDPMAVNTALQRGLVKTIAYHGFGLLLYEGAADELIAEEEPEQIEEKIEEKPKAKPKKAKKEEPEVKINPSTDGFRGKMLDHHADIVEMEEGEQFATINGDSDAFDIVEKVFSTFMPSLGDRAGANPEEGFSGEPVYDTNDECVKAVEAFYKHNKDAIGMIAENAPEIHKRVMGFFKEAKKAAQSGEVYSYEEGEN